MTKRLQVLLDDDELRDDSAAREARRHMTTAPMGTRRHAGRGRGRDSTRRQAVKLAALRRAAMHAFPTGDIDQLIAETEQGYLEPDA